MDAKHKKKVKEWKDPQRASARAALPLTKQKMKGLFASVDKALAQSPCDHTLRHAHAYLKEAGIAAEPVVAWLQAHGGCCDCEVILNAEDAWQEAIR